jgi:hypothetical protein
MKLRPGFLLAAAFIVLVMSSCMREYICQCHIVYSGQPGLPDTTVNEYTIINNKKKAKSECNSHSTSTTKNGIKTVETCDLY